MKSSLDIAIVSSPGYLDVASIAYDARFIVAASAQAVTTGSSAAGSLEPQVSNDQYSTGIAVPTNWSTIGSAVSISGAGSYLIPFQNISYEHIRAIFTSTAPGEQIITTVADVGELNFAVETLRFVDGPPDGGGLTDFASGVISGANVALNNITAGPFTPAFDGVAAPTVFTFALAPSNGTIGVNIKTLGY